MQMRKFLKGGVAILMAAALAVALNGCGGKKKTTFKVTANKLPKGVISVTQPAVNKETAFVRGMVQEAFRRYLTARLYTEALIRYDVAKGNAKQHQQLLRKTQAAWKSARNCASVASFYAIGLSRLERTEGWDKFSQTAWLGVPAYNLPSISDFRLTRMAYAAEANKKAGKKSDSKKLEFNSADDVFKRFTKNEIMDMMDKFPESKMLLGISNALHVNGQTACQIMNTVNPDYQKTGRTWSDLAYDAAYRGSSVLKTAGKAAGVGLAAVGAATAATPALVFIGGAAVVVKVVDTGLDAVQTGFVVFTGEEDKSLNKALAVTGMADTVVTIATFDLTKPILGNSLKNGATLGQYVEGTLKGTREATKLMATGKIKDAVKLISTEGFLNASSVITGVMGLGVNFDTIVVTENQTEDGKTEIRTGTLSAKNGTEADKEKAEALGISLDDAKKQAEATEKGKAEAATASSDEMVKEAETASAAGGADKSKETVDKFVEETREDLAKEVLGEGISPDNLDQVINSSASDEIKETGKISGEISGEVSGKVSGEISGEISGKASGEASGNDSGTESGEKVKDKISGEVSGQEDKDAKNDGVKEEKEEESDDKSAAESEKEEKLMESGQVSGETSGEVSGKTDEDAPYAIHKVIGATWTNKFQVEGKTYTQTAKVVRAGKGIAITGTDGAGGKMSIRVTEYDPQTGKGRGENTDGSGHGSFQITGKPGNMRLSFSD